VTEAAPPSVYIIDDEKDVRVALSLELRASGFAARPFASAADFLDEVAHLAPGCLLLDVRMPGQGGIDLLDELARREIRWPAVMMTAHGEVATAVQAMKLGAVEFLEKPFGPEALQAALDRGFQTLSASARQSGIRQQARDTYQSLTPREQEVFRLVVQGNASKTVALQLDLSHRTVEMHRANMMRKLGAATLVDLVRLAVELGMPTERR
jgi:two-component system response regulator FixJ